MFFEKKLLGSIDFVFKDNKQEWGFYSNPFLSLAGLGRIFEQIGIFYALNILRVKSLHCEVFAKNKEVLNLHKKFSFKEDGVRELKGEKIICLSLTI